MNVCRATNVSIKDHKFFHCRLQYSLRLMMMMVCLYILLRSLPLSLSFSLGRSFHSVSMYPSNFNQFIKIVIILIIFVYKWMDVCLLYDKLCFCFWWKFYQWSFLDGRTTLTTTFLLDKKFHSREYLRMRFTWEVCVCVFACNIVDSTYDVEMNGRDVVFGSWLELVIFNIKFIPILNRSQPTEWMLLYYNICWKQCDSKYLAMVLLNFEIH